MRPMGPRAQPGAMRQQQQHEETWYDAQSRIAPSYIHPPPPVTQPEHRPSSLLPPGAGLPYGSMYNRPLLFDEEAVPSELSANRSALLGDGLQNNSMATAPRPASSLSASRSRIEVPLSEKPAFATGPSGVSKLAAPKGSVFMVSSSDAPWNL